MDTAVLDACVLFRGGARDFLLWVAEAAAFSPVWSDTIHEEWTRSRRDKLGDPMARLNYAREEMEKAFPGANFDPDPETLSTISLPDMSDIHVVATAVAAQAKSIVTYNVRHFPERVLAPRGLSAAPALLILALILAFPGQGGRSNLSHIWIMRSHVLYL